jgi:epoxide hydrolase 4
MTNLNKVVRSSRIPTNGIHLHVMEAGPSDGPLVFLLHGFPEFWYGWRNQIAPLAECGFHVVAPDQRGYNLSDKPKGVASYDLDQLASDVVGLADYFGQHGFAVVGHDWGGSIGWWLAGRHTSRVRQLAVLNAPHPAVWLHAMRNDPAQKHKSGYVRFFRIPYLPEVLIALNRSKTLAKGFRDTVRPGAFEETDLAQYRKAWAQPRALTAMLDYYRAILKKALLPPADYPIICPTLVIWGKCDAYAISELGEASVRLCVNGRIEFLDRSTHWVQHDEPGRVTDLLVGFLG